MDTMERLKEWVEQGKRSVEITFNTHLSFNLSIWVYDYDLMVGIHVDNISDVFDVDFAEIKRKEDLKKYEELKNKFQEE